MHHIIHNLSKKVCQYWYKSALFEIDQKTSLAISNTDKSAHFFFSIFVQFFAVKKKSQETELQLEKIGNYC